MATPSHIGYRDAGDGLYNPGLQTQIEPVLRDKQIYDAFVGSITLSDTLGSLSEKYQQDIFSRSPLSAVLGFWNMSHTITVSVSSPDVPSAPEITHTYTNQPLDQKVVISVLGFVARANRETINLVRVVDADGREFTTSVTVAPLPATDAQANMTNGFPELQVNKTGEYADVGDDLYFVVVSSRRAFIAYDRQANVRWYIVAGNPQNDPALWLPTYNNIRLSDGSFIGSDDHLQHYYTPTDLGPNEPNGQRELWRFDATGRVLGIYFTRDRAHHSLLELPGENALLYASDYLSTRQSGEGPNPDGANQGPTSEDCIAILDLATGYEKVYYDLRSILNFWRTPVPMDFSVPNTYDWAHLNQVVLDSDSNLLIASCRHQGAIIGIDRETGALRFISANHDDWQVTETGDITTDWSDLLLTPVNPVTNQPYDLTDPAQKAEADHVFWTWGQHNVQEVIKAQSNPSLVEFSVFNNGNYRTRTMSEGVVPSQNASRCAHYQVDLKTREVRKLVEYGETEMGATGYSSYVSTATFFRHQNNDAFPRLLANFGGSIFQSGGDEDIAGLPLTVEPGISDRIDPAENLAGYFQGRVILQEVDMNTRMPLFEIRLTSGTFKAPPGGDIRRVDFYSFRAYKMPLYS
ncbi:aryl-sulfate sulfotransferase [Atlantibacter sp.]|uniref:aryl-sulfate sulfotransferase n=1 Tax=Atlantibacter sp. TaxID=1903473 RepID=UPI0028AB547D|nr:aryl-sulfate sulfotransferase [Atlantibacter sp.]